MCMYIHAYIDIYVSLSIWSAHQRIYMHKKKRKGHIRSSFMLITFINRIDCMYLSLSLSLSVLFCDEEEEDQQHLLN